MITIIAAIIGTTMTHHSTELAPSGLTRTTRAAGITKISACNKTLQRSWKVLAVTCKNNNYGHGPLS